MQGEIIGCQAPGGNARRNPRVPGVGRTCGREMTARHGAGRPERRPDWCRGDSVVAREKGIRQMGRRPLEAVAACLKTRGGG